MQELIYPNHLFTFPGQLSPVVGPLVVLLRSNILLYTALATLLAGAGVLRAARRLAAATPHDAKPSPPRTAAEMVMAPVGARVS